MNILQLGKFYPIRGGVEKVMYDLMLGLSETGTRCDMLCASTENYPAGTLSLNPHAKLIIAPTQIKLAATMLAPAMITILRKIAKEYDIIHIHHPDPMATLALFLSGYKGKVILHWHSDILKQKNLLKIYKPLQSWLIKRANLIVGTTPVYVQESPFLQHVQAKIDYIPIGVLPIKADQEQVNIIRERYQGKKLIFSLGRLVEYKGYEYLIRAAQELDNTYHIVIGGKGPLMESLSQLIIDLGVQDRVTLLGFVSDEEVSNYFQAADAFCLSSILKTEAFAIVQIEAMSCAKPIVSAYIPGSGVTWVNQDQVSGLVVPNSDPQALAEALKKLFTDISLYDNLAKGSRRRFNQNFTRASMVDKCLQLYKNI
jgi:glycosyltransferase involved in cell wall biosynthesis